MGASIVGRGSHRARSSHIKSTLSRFNHRNPTGQRTVKIRLTLVLDHQGFRSGGALVIPASPSLRVLLSTPTPLSHALVLSLPLLFNLTLYAGTLPVKPECDPAVAAGQQSKGATDKNVCLILQLNCV